MDPDPYELITDTDPDPGGPKTYGSYESGSGTLLKTYISLRTNHSKTSENLRNT